MKKEDLKDVMQSDTYRDTYIEGMLCTKLLYFKSLIGSEPPPRHSPQCIIAHNEEDLYHHLTNSFRAIGQEASARDTIFDSVPFRK